MTPWNPRKLLSIASTAAAVGALAVAGATPASAQPVPATQQAPAAATTLTYDSSGSAEFADVVEEGVANWNASVANVQLVPAAAGQRANITILADDGWPRATIGPVTPGTTGTVWFGREAVDDGYDLSRIITHELGHSLGLPDDRTGECADLMSGSSAPVDCANDLPNAEEKAEVEANYATGAAAPSAAPVLVDAP